MSSNRIQQIGILEPGPDWESLYRPALQRLTDRVQVAAVFDGVPRTAQMVAEQLDARPVSAIRSLFESDLVGVLCCHIGWYGLYPMQLAVAAKKPFYTLVPFTVEMASLATIARSAHAEGTLIFPELRLRYMPAALRLKELCATSLGEIEQLTVDVRIPRIHMAEPLLLELLDWVVSLFRHQPDKIEALAESDPTSERTIVLQSPQPKQSAQIGTLRFREENRSKPVETKSTAPAGALQHVMRVSQIPIECTVQCRHGEARLEDAETIRWRSGGQERIESLSTDRTDVDVAVDLFARRLAGGLIPVPDLDDILLARRLMSLVRQSQAAGTPLAVPERFSE